MRDQRLAAAMQAVDRAVFGGGHEDLDHASIGLDALESDLALARGKILHAQFLADRTERPGELELFERSAALRESGGDERGLGEALFWVGCYHQVVRDDDETATATLERSRELATRTEDRLTESYALRHLGLLAHGRGDGATARGLLEESTRLRRDLRFDAGAAANMVGLIHIAVDEGRKADAIALADEAAELALASGATVIAGQVAEARSRAES